MLSVSCKIIKSRKCYNFMVVLAVKNLPPLRDMGLILGSGRSPGGGHGNPLQYSFPGESPRTEEPGDDAGGLGMFKPGV